MTGQHTPNTPGLVALARAELAQIRVNACRHGVVRSRVQCAECEKAEKPKPERPECPTHAGEWADACRACAADQKAGNA